MKIGKKIHRIQTCSSTNDFAKALAESGAEQGEVVVCDEQTKGKGTKGRTWHSLPGKGLYFSALLFPSRSDLSLLPLTASLAIREGVFNELDMLMCLKWPNDLIGKGLKIGGILCESSFSGRRLNYSIIGIGINVKHKKNDFPVVLQNNAGSLEMICSKKIDKDRLMFAICGYLEKWYRAFLKNEDQKILKAYLEASCYRIGDKLKIEAKGNIASGLFRGLDREGKIILEINAKEERFLSGEIRIINS
jgi:BirA family biotin operon repressor/biotin-[acetyl-CoA-carboxylase] ligase